MESEEAAAVAASEGESLAGRPRSASDCWCNCTLTQALTLLLLVTGCCSFQIESQVSVRFAEEKLLCRLELHNAIIMK